MRAVTVETGGSQIEVIDASKIDLHVASTVVRKGTRALWISTVITRDPRERQQHYETAIFDVRRGRDWLSQRVDGTVSVHGSIRHGLRMTIHPSLVDERQTKQGTRPAALRRHEQTIAAVRLALGDIVSA